MRNSLTRLLSYSLRDSENSLALEIDIPQNGRYICSTCVDVQKHVEGHIPFFCVRDKCLTKGAQTW